MADRAAHDPYDHLWRSRLDDPDFADRWEIDGATVRLATPANGLERYMPERGDRDCYVIVGTCPGGCGTYTARFEVARLAAHDIDLEAILRLGVDSAKRQIARDCRRPPCLCVAP